MKRIYPKKISVFCIHNKTELLKQINYRKNFDDIFLKIPNCYSKAMIPKKNGGNRTLFIPNKKLKDIQKRILKNLLEKVKLPKCVYGGVKNKSIVENALMHAKSRYLINVDIKNFFPSVHYSLINKLFLDLGCKPYLSEILTKLTTFKYCLPQGAPTSPYLANLVLNNLDYRFYNLSRKFNLIYTRYFDDISLSGSKKLINLKDDFIKIIIEEGYKIKIEKIKEFNPGTVKEITGILINKNGELSLKKQKELKKYLINISNEGIKILNSDNIEKEKLSVLGKINFIKNLNKKEGCNLENIFKKIDWENLKY